MKRLERFPLLLCALLLAAGGARAAVVRVDVSSRAPLVGGRSWGLAGPYEKVSGTMHFAVRPDDRRDRAVVDLDLAPRNAKGEVEFSADFYVLRPVDPRRGSGAMLLEVPNRGHKEALSLMNRGEEVDDPEAPGAIGDGFLMRRGVTVAWVGWQWDVPKEPGRMRLDAPTARRLGGSPITGLVRADFNVDGPEASHPLGHRIVGEIGGESYPVSDRTSPRNVLTERDAPDAPRKVVPRRRWRFAREENGRVVPDDRSVWLEGGFAPGKIYEVVYVATDPVVAGLGLAAIRDAASYFKNDPACVAPAQFVYGLGISQSGRFLRQFLAQGFNEDERGRKVFDGLFIHVAGAGVGSFNHRFAQPSRAAQATSSILFPTDLFPFTYGPETDPKTGATAGLLDRARADRTVPKIFSTNTSCEYWGAAASLTTTTPDGRRDAEIPPEVRIYFLAGLQHFTGPFPPVADPYPELRATHPENPNPVDWLWRALYEDMDAWVRDGVPPPESRFPKVSDGTLVSREALVFPRIPGLVPPAEVHRARRRDYGPRWQDGIVTKEPPGAGRPFVSLVPQVDADGNDLGGVRIPEMAVPVASYTGWNLRDPETGFAGERVSFIGAYDPFPATRSERAMERDPRASLEERYGSEDRYLGIFARAAIEQVRERFLLPGDLPAALDRGEEEFRAARRGSSAEGR
jgi:hypothetical protein